MHQQANIEDMDELNTMRQQLVDRVSQVMNKGMEYLKSFEEYKELWESDRLEFMKQFLIYGKTLTEVRIAEVLEAVGSEHWLRWSLNTPNRSRPHRW